MKTTRWLGGWAARRLVKTARWAMLLSFLAAYPTSRLVSQQVPGQGADSSVGRLYAPEAVQMRERTTPRDDEEIVKTIEHKIKCQCGCNLDVFTCRTTDFTCTTSPAMHRLVLARLDSSMTADQVVATFVAQYGASALMEPPKHGFNLSAYIMPFVGLGVGLGLLGLAMRRVVQRHTAEVAAAGSPAEGGVPVPDDASPEELARLKDELDRFEA